MLLAAALPFMLTSCVTADRSAPPASARSNGIVLDDAVQVIAADFAAPARPDGPSFLVGRSGSDQVRATLCLASAVYYEAATEPDEGQRAVAQVVLNRVRHPAWPNTVCGVVYQGSDQSGCQFSFACDGAMGRQPSLPMWTRARRVAEAALAGMTYEPVGSATFYHTKSVAPAWRLRLMPVAVVGAHIFYRQPQDAASAATLPMHYAGHEPNPGPLPRVVPPAQLAALARSAVSIALDTAQAAPAVIVSGDVPRSPTPAKKSVSQDDRYLPGALSDSNILPQYRQSGQWIDGTPIR